MFLFKIGAMQTSLAQQSLGYCPDSQGATLAMSVGTSNSTVIKSPAAHVEKEVKCIQFEVIFSVERKHLLSMLN